MLNGRFKDQDEAENRSCQKLEGLRAGPGCCGKVSDKRFLMKAVGREQRGVWITLGSDV